MKKKIKAKVKKTKRSKTKRIKKIARHESSLSITNVKMNGKDRKRIKANAKKFAKGSISAWVRHAGLNYKPKKGEEISANGYK